MHVYSHQLITSKSVLLDATTVLDLAMSAVELMNDDDFESVVVFENCPLFVIIKIDVYSCFNSSIFAHIVNKLLACLFIRVDE